MQNLMKTFMANEDKAKEGQWCDFDKSFGFEHDGEKFFTRFLLKHASVTNGPYYDMVQRLSKKFITRKGKNKASVEQAMDVEVRAFCSHVLAGWENFEEARPQLREEAIKEHGKPILKYSYETAIEIMKSCPELFQMLLEWAQEPGNFNQFGEAEKKPSVADSENTFPKS